MERIPDRAGAWLREHWLLLVYLLTALAVSAQSTLRSPDNNFLIFRAAARHLVEGRNLYAAYPGEFLDLFKYSPTFALLFAPFALLPLSVALAAWSLLNAIALYWSVVRLLPSAAARLALALVYFEVLHSMQRAQSNALVTALVILAFLAIERQRIAGAAAAIAAGAAIKIFPLAAATFGIFQPKRLRFGLFLLGWGLAFALLPLAATSPRTLSAQYHSWATLVAADTADRSGAGGAVYGGLMGGLRLWFGIGWPNWPVQLAGTALLLLPLALGRSRWSDPSFRLRYLCSLLIYLVIFNHQTESPTFVIAVTGIAIWFATEPRTPLSIGIMALTLLLVSGASGDLLPVWIRRDFMVPWRVKTIPCVLAWAVIQWQLFRDVIAGSASQRGETREDHVTAPEPRAELR
ncbi:MAG: DUF2029 domain-containing protein [Gemmatimonadota bacterium]|nr:DUF2029 domain-containing protein [Gemmatimonadota bacterium]